MSQYTMQTTRIVELRDGVYWEANLLFNGDKIGTILEEGNGGASKIAIDNKEQRKAWEQHCKENSGEESVVYFMMLSEIESMNQ